MDIETIRDSVDEIAANAASIRDEDIIETYLTSLEELEEQLEIATEHVEDDSDYQDIMETIEETKQIFTETLDSIYNEDEEDEETDDY